jgi:pimeloyl-ACP methyl ester carboxylesterase
MLVTIHADVGPLAPDGEPNRVTMDVHLPERLASQPAMLFCLPGGGVTRRYFDLDGGPGSDFSFARAMTSAGHVVVAVDPVGIGDSTRPVDGFALTAQAEAELVHRAFLHLREQVIEGVALGSLRVVGTGHSAGAMLAVVQQATNPEFSALLLFCFGTAGLPELLDPAQRSALTEPDGGRSRLAEFARAKFAGQSYFETPTRDADTPAGRALRAVHDRVIAVLAIQAMTPGSVARELAAIEVPVFLAVGERDMTGPAHRLAADYVACRDFTLYVVPNSGHHVFVSSGAPRLYGRVLNWLGSTAVSA